MNGLFLARALHVLGVVIWIGGVYMATTIILPALRRGDLGADRMTRFHVVENRFKWHARIAVIVVGASGLYMLQKLQLWGMFAHINYWWLHAMVIVWTLFALMLFVIEPFIMHRRFARMVERDPERALARLYRAHVVLLTLSIITVLAATAGAHGWHAF